MRNLVFITALWSLGANAQVFNQGVEEVAFKNMMNNGIVYINTDDASFDSSMFKALQNTWKLTEFRVEDKFYRSNDKETVLITTEKRRTGEGRQDKKNPNILVLLPGGKYKFNTPVKMDYTLGYIYFNGFNDRLKEEHEFRLCHLMLNCLQSGLKTIKEKGFNDTGTSLNERVSASIIEDNETRLGNWLIINRQQTVHYLNEDWLKKSGIKYRLLTDVEYNKTLDERDPNHYVLYFAENLFTEFSLMNSATGEMIYMKHFLKDHPEMTKKDFKSIVKYFK